MAGRAHLCCRSEMFSLPTAFLQKKNIRKRGGGTEKKGKKSLWNPREAARERGANVPLEGAREPQFTTPRGSLHLAVCAVKPEEAKAAFSPLCLLFEEQASSSPGNSIWCLLHSILSASLNINRQQGLSKLLPGPATLLSTTVSLSSVLVVVPMYGSTQERARSPAKASQAPPQPSISMPKLVAHYPPALVCSLRIWGILNCY